MSEIIGDRAISDNRQKFSIAASGAVETVIGPRIDWAGRSEVAAYFRCISCEDAISWIEEKRLFECGSCGYEMTPGEAVIVCDYHTKELNKLASLAGKKKSWICRFFRLFGGRKRPRLN